jgi:hypothetical protein
MGFRYQLVTPGRRRLRCVELVGEHVDRPLYGLLEVEPVATVAVEET